MPGHFASRNSKLIYLNCVLLTLYTISHSKNDDLAGWVPPESRKGSPPIRFPGPACVIPNNKLRSCRCSPEVRKQIDIVRLKADLAAASVELLSAHCAADRVRLQYSPQDIVAFGEPRTLKRAIASAEALYRFFSQIAGPDRTSRKTRTGKRNSRLRSLLSFVRS